MIYFHSFFKKKSGRIFILCQTKNMGVIVRKDSFSLIMRMRKFLIAICHFCKMKILEVINVPLHYCVDCYRYYAFGMNIGKQKTHRISYSNVFLHLTQYSFCNNTIDQKCDNFSVYQCPIAITINTIVQWCVSDFKNFPSVIVTYCNEGVPHSHQPS